MRTKRVQQSAQVNRCTRDAICVPFVARFYSRIILLGGIPMNSVTRCLVVAALQWTLLANIATAQDSVVPSRSAVLPRSGTGGGGTVGGDGGAGGRAPGGSSFADFTSLIELIQTTVNPESWEENGGEGTISEYPQGVYVDGKGTLQTIDATMSNDDAASSVLAMLSRGTDQQTTKDWKSPSTKRYVSLRRLRQAIMAAEKSGHNPDHAMSHMAGLSQITSVFLSGDDIVLAGPVSGVVKHRGWMRDPTTGMATIRIDVFSEVVASLHRGNVFGCTIDPTREGLQNAAKVARQVHSKQLPIGKADEALADAIGMQRIEVFGTHANTPVALMMVLADHHMKELALGVHPMPEACSNYLDAIEANIDRGLPNQLLLRLWFTANARSVRSNREQTVFELSGTPLKLSGENERAVADGSRGHRTTDFRTTQFVKAFNDNWTQIRADYPIYAGLESVFQAASAAATGHRFAKTDDQRKLLEWWATLGDRLNGGSPAWSTPTQVKTLAILHSFRHRRKRHHLLIASGGVLMQPNKTISQRVASYPTLARIKTAPGDANSPIQTWWWDQ